MKNSKDNSIVLQIRVQMPEPSTGEPPKYKQSIEERVRHCLDLIDSGHESFREWELIRKLNNELRSRMKAGRLNRRGLAILKMIEPVVQKYSIESNTFVDTTTRLSDSE